VSGQTGSNNNLDIEQFEALKDYLRGSGRIGQGEEIACRILAGGVSNRAVLVERANGEAWVVKQALEKLRVELDWFSSPARIRNEALGLEWLEKIAPAGTITPLIFFDFNAHLLAMQAVPQPHHNWKSLLLQGFLQEDHVDQFGKLLGTIHRNAFSGKAELAEIFADRTFFESLRVEPYYSFTASQVPEAAGFLKELILETRATRQTLVHGDYSPKNILVYKDKLILLDHEVIHFGDPAFDLGFSLTHLLSKAHYLPPKRSDFVAAANRYWQVYSTTLGDLDWKDGLEERAIRHTLACLLARVAGRSPLEYLDKAQRARQQSVVLDLLQNQPTSLAALFSQFSERL
jgi:5-methylthioribose kinase